MIQEPKIIILGKLNQIMPCHFLRIMISYLCVKFQSLTNLRNKLLTNGRINERTNRQMDECEFIDHHFVKPVTNKVTNDDHMQINDGRDSP